MIHLLVLLLVLINLEVLIHIIHAWITLGLVLHIKAISFPLVIEYNYHDDQIT